MDEPDVDSPPSPQRLEQLCVELATGAGHLVRERQNGAMSVDAKSTSTDLVTEVDRASERWLVERIAALRPHDAVLGEEGCGRAGTSGLRWLIDPIDGTVNFVLGIPQYAVSVAVEAGGRVVAGAVANPVSGEVFRAHLGGGAHLRGPAPAGSGGDLDEVRLGTRREVPLDRAVVGTGFAYAAETRARQAAVAAQLLPRVGDLRRLGSAALDLCFVAAGRLDGYFEAGLHPWDHAAGGLVARESGCVTSGLRGRPASGQLYLAAGPALAGSLGAALEELDADAVTG